MFGRATITLGIGPNSSSYFYRRCFDTVHVKRMTLVMLVISSVMYV